MTKPTVFLVDDDASIRDALSLPQGHARTGVHEC
jgi:FixJ family two-component response regulator